MNGINTLSKLYLGGDPQTVSVQEDQLLIALDNGDQIRLPLSLIGELAQTAEPLPSETQFLILRHPAQITWVKVDDHALHVYLKDGRHLSSPLDWFPRLLYGTETERNHYQLSGDNDVIHWPDLDEDIELTRLFSGGKSVESTHSVQLWLQSRNSKNKFIER